MGSLDFESEYETYRQSPAILTLFDGWSARSRQYRETRSSCALDIRYGAGERNTYDWFPADDPAAPLVVYIHGGYWQGGDRKSYSFLADALNTRGYDVAMPSYRLCPEVRVGEIAGDVLVFLRHLAGRVKKRPVLVGHSAGAHLAATILGASFDAADRHWRPVAAVGVSGVYDLLPLISTSLNVKLRLTPEEARDCSFRRQALPAGAALYCAVGGDESSEFHRQSLEAASTDRLPAADRHLVVPKRNHYTILGDLDLSPSPLSLMLERAVAHSAASKLTVDQDD